MLHINENDLSFKTALNYRFSNQGYDSTSILINCADMFFFLILMILYYILMFALYYLIWTPNSSQQTTGLDKLCSALYKLIYNHIVNERTMLFFNIIIRIGFEIFLDTLFSSVLNIYELTFRNATDIYSSIVALIWAVLMLVFACLVAVYSIWNPKFLNSKKVEVFSKDLKELRATRFFYFLFLIRRWTLVSLIIFMRHSGLIQLASFIVIWIIQFIYMALVRPFETKSTNFQEICYEIIMIFIIGSFYFFKNQETELATNGFSFILGWIWIGLVISTIIIHYFVLIVSLLVIISYRQK